MKLNTDKEDFMGPMAYNDEVKRFILKNGKKASEELPLKPDKLRGTKWCKDIDILHLPSGKVNAYSCYADSISKKITIFNGFFQKPIECDLNDLMWVYSSKRTKIGKYTDKNIKT